MKMLNRVLAGGAVISSLLLSAGAPLAVADVSSEGVTETTMYLSPAPLPLVRHHLSARAKMRGAEVVFTDQQPCGSTPRPGVFNQDIDYVGIEGCYWEETPNAVYLSPAGAEETWQGLSAETKRVWLYMLDHELSHWTIHQMCGTTAPGDVDHEALTDAYVLVSGGQIPGEWSYPFGDEEMAIASQIMQSQCPGGESND